MDAKREMTLTTSCRTALVTGASKGIGRGAALALAKLGCDVAVNYHSGEADAKAVVEEIERMGRRAVAVHADVSDPDQVEAMVEAVESNLGAIDALVVNAAYSIRKPWVEYEVSEINRTLGVSLGGAIHASHAVGKRMVPRGGPGKVVFISSLHAEFGFRNCGAYNIAKAGMQHLAVSLAAEWTEHRINVNIIQPGWIDTPTEEALKGREVINERALGLPWGRIGTIDDIGDAVAYLCSDQADYVTGAILRVDGGLGVVKKL